jgi:hypothetical protein
MLVVSLSLPACLADRKLGDLPEEAGDEADPTDDTTPDDPPAGPDGWPSGFDPRADVGDGTLDDDMLFVIQTPDGPFYLFMLAQRLGDGFQAWVQAASYDGTTWIGVGPDVFDSGSGPVDENAFATAFEDLSLSAANHPFGDETLTVDIQLEGRLYADELLCGFMDIDFEGGDDLFALPFVAVPVDEIGSDPAPAPPCR